LRTSKELLKIESTWINEKIIYYISDVRDKKTNGKKLIGPLNGTVVGVSTNEAMIEDRLEGLDRRNSICFTGELFVSRDNGVDFDTPLVNNCSLKELTK